MTPDQEANGDNLGNCFRFSTQKWYVGCTLDEAILMSTHNLQFHAKIRSFFKYLLSETTGRIS